MIYFFVKTAINQERNASGDSAMSPDQVSQTHLKKLQDRVSKCKDEVNKSREKYQVALQDINNYNAKYMEEMTNVFEQCQRMEAQRLQQFKEILFGVQKCLNISEDPVLPQIYEEFYHTVNNADHEKDLKWWSNTYGVNMPMNWPQFEEYTEEFRDIAGKSKKLGGPVTDQGITLINQRHVGDDLPEYSTTVNSRDNKSYNNDSKHRNGGTGNKTNNHTANSSGGLSRTEPNRTEPSYRTELSYKPSNPFVDGFSSSEEAFDEDTDDFYDAMALNGSTSGNGNLDRTPFDEEEWDEEGHIDPLVDNGEPGVKVRALYDYEAAESDELDFKAGDCFEKLEDEDEQGWCKGRKDGKVGLYPANYIEVI